MWFLDVSQERYEVRGAPGTSRLVVPGFSMDRRVGDTGVHARHGRRFVVEVGGAHRATGSDVSFLQALLRARWTRPVWGEGRLLVRAEIGATVVDDFASLPPSQRFFAGGSQSVRGFAYKSLGPPADGGDTVGGTRLVTASVEYQQRMRGDLYWAAFVDAGNAFDGGRLEPAIGVGLGLQWRSPLGPLAFYLARPLEPAIGGVRVHVDLGLDL